MSVSFPVNLSINDEAAHYTPEFSDPATVPEGAVIKIDLGARKDVYLTDCAITVSLSDKQQSLLRQARRHLKMQ